jgi:hypothetical protein
MLNFFFKGYWQTLSLNQFKSCHSLPCLVMLMAKTIAHALNVNGKWQFLGYFFTMSISS